MKLDRRTVCVVCMRILTSWSFICSFGSHLLGQERRTSGHTLDRWAWGFRGRYVHTYLWPYCLLSFGKMSKYICMGITAMVPTLNTLKHHVLYFGKTIILCYTTAREYVIVQNMGKFGGWSHLSKHVLQDLAAGQDMLAYYLAHSLTT